MKTTVRTVSAILGIVWLLNSGTPVHAQGTGFTYQGRLTNNGAAATGNHDLRFTVYDALSNGNAVAGPIVSASTTVNNGLFTVTLDFGAGVFPGAARWLEIAVRPGGSTGTYTDLTPRQPITATPYAITAGTVTAPIQGSQLAVGAAAANLNASGQSGVPSGGLVLSLTENEAFLNAGYVRIGTTSTSDAWLDHGNGVLAGRTSHTAVWTGAEMIVWGGSAASGALNTGGRYNPAGNSWTPVSTTGAPAPRSAHTAEWTGAEMIVWGGSGASGALNTGGRYKPAGNSWTAISTTGAPASRSDHTAVWTGTEMIIWGGSGVSDYLSTGGRYNPVINSWTTVSATGAPAARYYHTAMWTGTEMVVWGGWAGANPFNDTFNYTLGRVMYLYHRP